MPTYNPRSPIANYLLLGCLTIYALTLPANPHGVGGMNVPPGMTETHALVFSARDKGNNVIVEYRYEVAGKQYGGVIRMAKSIDGHLAIGAPIEVIYEQANPAQSFLAPASTDPIPVQPRAKKRRTLLIIGITGLVLNTCFVVYRVFRFGFKNSRTWV
jgi:hypothetical protein